MSSTLTDLTAATTWSGTDLFYALVGGNSRKIAASSFLVGEAVDVLSAVRSTNAQTLRIYSTFTDSSNYERLAVSFSSSAFDIKAETAGSGGDNLGLRFTTAGTGQLLFTNAGAVATVRIQCTSTSGYSAIDSYDSAGAQTGSFGYGGSATGGSLASRMYMYAAGAIAIILRTNSHNHIFDTTGQISLFNDIAMPAGGSTAARIQLANAANFGIYVGSGAPTVSAAQGSLYLRTDGGAGTRAYINTNSGTTWTGITTAA